MNLPNKLTILRTILIPFFLVALLCDKNYGGFIPYGNWIALVIFAIASLTDMLDGKIARKYNLVTNFGKFMDPLADKLLVSSAMIAFIELDRIPCWIVIIIIAREFIISGFRLVAADNGVVIAAGIWGKVKTAEQMVMLCIMIADFGSVFPAAADGIYIFENVLIYLALILTIVSLFDYLIHNKGVLSDNNNK
ncbi:MAG: CDP-diacylglycerol--glycerol-3-phosphate 3-phosphatidyltransferase [Lachnospiraceae bacterium]|nr:CDP-diacylglycerol--glycerol-3-phosphate 3-phosphatidyltransferase [Lachnospiraceae bacterium]